MGLFKKNKKNEKANELEDISESKIENEYAGLKFSEDDTEISIPTPKQEKKEIKKQEEDDLDFQIPHPMINHYNYILDLESRIRILESDMSKLYPAYAELITMYNSLVPLLDKKESEDKKE